MHKKLLLWTVIGAFGLFFGFIFIGLGVFLFTSPIEKLPLSLLVGVIILFFLFVGFGGVMLFRAARMITGDSERLSEIVGRSSSKDSSWNDLEPEVEDTEFEQRVENYEDTDSSDSDKGQASNDNS